MHRFREVRAQRQHGRGLWFCAKYYSDGFNAPDRRGQYLRTFDFYFEQKSGPLAISGLARANHCDADGAAVSDMVGKYADSVNGAVLRRYGITKLNPPTMQDFLRHV